jgi:Family of unknown function (DUF5681)
MTTKPKKSNAKKRSYEVGYGKPPVKHQFKPGESGNKKGRPKITPTVSELAARELKRKRLVVIEGKEVKIETAEFLLRRAVIAAGKSLPFFRAIFALAEPAQKKARIKQMKVKLIEEGMTPQAAADLYFATMRQPADYGDEEKAAFASLLKPDADDD